MSHPNKTMTKEEIATEFRRSMAELEEFSDGLDSPRLDNKKNETPLRDHVYALWIVAIVQGACIGVLFLKLLLR